MSSHSFLAVCVLCGFVFSGLTGCGADRTAVLAGDPYYNDAVWHVGKPDIRRILQERGYSLDYEVAAVPEEWEALLARWEDKPPDAVLLSPFWADRLKGLRSEGVPAAVLGASRPGEGVVLSRETAFQEAGRWLAEQMKPRQIQSVQQGERGVLLFDEGTPDRRKEQEAFLQGWREAAGEDPGGRLALFEIRRDREREDMRRFLDRHLGEDVKWAGLFAGRFNREALDLLEDASVKLIGEGSLGTADLRYRGAVVIPPEEVARAALEQALAQAREKRGGPAEGGARGAAEPSRESREGASGGAEASVTVQARWKVLPSGPD